MSWMSKVGGVDDSPIGRVLFAVRRVILPIAAVFAGAARRALGMRSFTIDGREYPYVVAGFNETWRNERCVELGFVFDWLDRRGPGSVLEVGNVLSHYRKRDPDHVVVDLYEQGEGVLNVDALTYEPGRKFRSIVLVSTLEHVGFDEDDQDPDKPRRLVEHLVTLLEDDGELLITMPFGHNQGLDAQVAAGKLGFDELYVLRRMTILGAWAQVGIDQIPRLRYGLPYHRANGVGFAIRRAAPVAATAAA